jgi:hypothetical protein
MHCSPARSADATSYGVSPTTTPRRVPTASRVTSTMSGSGLEPSTSDDVFSVATSSRMSRSSSASSANSGSPDEARATR